MQDQVIVGVSGRKQAGKNTSYSCIRLWRPEAQDFSFADSLKRMCIDVLGLEEWQVYGTDEQKNTFVPHLLWENFPLPVYDTKGHGPGFIGYPNGQRWKAAYSPELCGDGIAADPALMKNVTFSPQPAEFDWHGGDGIQFKFKDDPDVAWHDGVELCRSRGPMTARQVLQYWGTEIFRKAYHQVWADACIRKIRKSGCSLAVITDCRFPNEVEAIQQAGGKVIKLTRVVFPDDNHPSETSLDPENFDQGRFDFVLDNAEMDVNQQCEALYGLLRRWGIVEGKKVHRMHI